LLCVNLLFVDTLEKFTSFPIKTHAEDPRIL
jgi:hypothetical protein